MHTDGVDRDWLQQRALNVIGHELRTPAATIRGIAEVLASGDGDEPAPALVEALVRNARRLEGLLDDLLAAAGIASALPTETPDAVEVAVAVAQRRSDGAVIVEGSAVARVRRSSLDRIIDPILDNAAAYGDSPAAVSVSTSGGRVTVSVASPGPPANEEDVRYGLEPFWRGERAVTMRPGLGLGLTIADALARHEGGRVWLEARPGGGLLTVVDLPAA